MTSFKFSAPNRAEAIVQAIPGAAHTMADVGYDLGRIALLALSQRPGLRVVGVEIQPDAGRRALARMRDERVDRAIVDRFEPRTGDGLAPLVPGEVEGVLMAGMGEPTMLKALAQCPDVAVALEWMILCTPTLESLLRPAMRAMGRCVRTAAIAHEQGRFYEVLHVGRGAENVEAASDDPVESAWGEEIFTSIDRPLARAFVDDIERRFSTAIKAGLKAYSRESDRWHLGRRLGCLADVKARLAG